MKQIFFGFLITALVLVGLWKLIPVPDTHANTAKMDAQTVQAQVAENIQFAQGPFDGKTLGVRISGLVCDLCISGIENTISELPNVLNVKAVPRHGIIMVALKGEPDQKTIQAVLLKEGYKVHAFTLSDMDFNLAIENPSNFALLLWKDGAKEQQLVMSTPEGQKATCEKKTTFNAYQQSAWGGDLQSNSVEH